MFAVKKKLKRLIKSILKFVIYKFVYPVLYFLYSRKPLKDAKVVFVETTSNKLTNNLEALYTLFESKSTYSLRTFFLKQNALSYFSKIKNEIRLIKRIANAKYIFIDDTCFPLSTFKIRKGSHLVQLWHGCGAFKKFSFSTADLIFGASRKEQLRYPSHLNYSFVTVSSAEVIPHFAEAMRLPESKILPIGVSRTDCFFDKSFINKAREKVHDLIPQSNNKQIILYAPTFRGRTNNAKSGDKLNYELLYNLLNKNYIILVKYHPFVRKRIRIDEQLSNFVFDVTDLLTIDELICVSDICITDYSSLIFEYSLFSKPMIFFAYDLDNYIDWRGFYYKYEDFVPGPIVKNTTELLEVIKNISSYNIDKVEAFRKKFMSSCDGNSTKRIYNTLIDLDKKYS